LLKALQNFLANEWDYATAVKRGNGVVNVSLGDLEGEERFLADPSALPPEAEFERAWAVRVIENAINNLEGEIRSGGKESLWERLRPHLQGDRNGPPYSELSADLRMSEGALRVTVHRWRQRYGELLRSEVARTVGEHGDVEAELRHLIEIVSR
jgi:RNA polymerase sigma-70 factor (ECF subfamily)